MGAPLGNQNGVGHGRPPNKGYSKEEVIALGEEFLKWMRDQDADPKSDVVHLSEWYSEIKQIPCSQWESIIVRDCFIGYYERAKKWMGKRTLKNKDLPPSYGNRFIGIYFKEVRDHERSEMEHKVEYEIKKKLQAALSSGIPTNDPTLDAILTSLKKQEINVSKSETSSELLASD